MCGVIQMYLLLLLLSLVPPNDAVASFVMPLKDFVACLPSAVNTINIIVIITVMHLGRSLPHWSLQPQARLLQPSKKLKKIKIYRPGSSLTDSAFYCINHCISALNTCSEVTDNNNNNNSNHLFQT